jgi:hypothetical protein
MESVLSYGDRGLCIVLVCYRLAVRCSAACEHGDENCVAVNDAGVTVHSWSAVL